MTVVLRRCAAFPLLAAALAASPAAAQLAPPSGAVAPTQSIEIFAVPFTINQPGSYRLARSLTATAAGNMITVSAADVTLDLGGHTLNGGGVAATGVQIGAGGDRLHITNGHITNTTGSCIGAAFQSITVENVTLSNSLNGNGIGAANGKACIIRNVTVHTVGLNGIAASAGSVLENVTVTNAANRGFDCNGQTTLRSCVAIGSGSDGILIGGITGAVVENCIAESNDGSGFVVPGGSVLRGCKAAGNGGAARASGGPAAEPSPETASGAAPVAHPFDGYVNPMVVDARISVESAGIVSFPLPGARGLGSGDDGIRAGDGSVIESCLTNGNFNDGIAAGDGSTIRGCTSRSNGGGGIIAGAGVTIADCTASGNTGVGIGAGLGSRLSGCTAHGNSVGGIMADDRSLVQNCRASVNTGPGFTTDAETKLIGCHSSGNTGASSDGFTASGADSSLIGCAGSNNGRHGIHVTAGSGTSVRECYVSSNTGDGINVAGSFAFVVQNHIELDSLVHPDTSNAVGPVVTGSDLSTAVPWANFSF